MVAQVQVHYLADRPRESAISPAKMIPRFRRHDNNSLAHHLHQLSSPSSSSYHDPSLTTQPDYSHIPTSEQYYAPSTFPNTQYSTIAGRSHSHPQYFVPTSGYNPNAHIQQPTSNPAAVAHNTRGDGSTTPVAWWPHSQRAHLFQNQRGAVPGSHLLHRRNLSGSSIASAGPASPFTPTTSDPRIVDLDAQGYQTHNLDTLDSAPSNAFYSKPPPAPTSHFSDPGYPRQFHNDYYSNSGNAGPIISQGPSRQCIMAQQQEMGVGGTDGSASADNQYNNFAQGYRIAKTMPELSRTMSEIYQDELWNPEHPAIPPPPPQQPQKTAVSAQSSLLSPRRDIFAERLQDAKNGHLSERSSASPASRDSREKSPYLPASPLFQEEFAKRVTPARLGSAAQMREQQKAEEDAIAMAKHDPNARRNFEPQKTISPQEALLDYEEPPEGTNMQLFPQNTVSNLNGGMRIPSMKQESTEENQVPSASQQSYHSMATTRRESSSNQSTNSSSKPMGGRGGVPNVPQQYPFIAQSRRQTSSMQSTGESVPDFPAHLTSMESTKSDAAPPSSHGSESDSSYTSVQRPLKTTADSGTYTCTYHGCTKRFETPAKLQKHKREGHRQSTPSQAAAALGSPAAAAIAARNSQAGPHKCERINPSTGKPCNSVFSRPYDLTRHEDTIHNVRKQKVRCQFCTEEKTFSRNDALTRHMRVVHPEVDFMGKSKRK
jgi:26S proteasome regulatory subunit N4